MQKVICSQCTPFICKKSHVKCNICQKDLKTAPLYQDRVYKNVEWGSPCASLINISEGKHLGECVYAHKTCISDFSEVLVKISKNDIKKHLKSDEEQIRWVRRMLKRRHLLLKEHGFIRNDTNAPTDEELDGMNSAYGKEYLNFVSGIEHYMKYVDPVIPCSYGQCRLGHVMVRAVTKDCLKLYEIEHLLKGNEPEKDSTLFELLEGQYAVEAYKEIYDDRHTTSIHKIYSCADAAYKYNVFVISINEHPVGVYSITDKEDGRLYINNTYILTEYRGKGLYSKCLQACMLYCQHLNTQLDSKFHEIYFVCKPENVAVYKRALLMGFETRENGDEQYPLQVFKTLTNETIGNS